MSEHPISSFMDSTMSKIREMVDVNTIIGNAINTDDGLTIIPVSKVTFGFAGGGADFQTKHHSQGTTDPFGGGTGAGVSITPVAFLVVKEGSVRVLNIAPPVSNTADRIVDMAPDFLDKVGTIVDKAKKKGE